MLKRYWVALKDYPLGLVVPALEMAEKLEEFFPKPATIIKLIGLVHEERSRIQPENNVAEWERDRRLHPNEYYTQEEIPGVMEEIRKRLGFTLDIGKHGKPTRTRKEK